MTDTQGDLLEVLVHPADVQDRDGAKPLLARLRKLHCWVRVVLGDGGYRYRGLEEFCRGLRIDLVTIQRDRKAKGMGPFGPVPQRWVVERTFAWLGRWRRLSRDYEELAEVSRAMVQVAAVRTLLQRLTNPPKPTLTGKAKRVPQPALAPPAF